MTQSILGFLGSNYRPLISASLCFGICLMAILRVSSASAIRLDSQLNNELHSSIQPMTPALAITLTVNMLGDADDIGVGDGICDTQVAVPGAQCTLRAAVQEANAFFGDDTINFSVTGTINLATALPDITTNMSVNGPGAGMLTVQRSTTPGTPQFSLFRISQNVTFAISGLTLSNADSFENGGAIRNSGPLTLEAVNIFNNRTSSGGSAIFNGGTGTVTLANSTISNNVASLGSIYNQGGTFTITNSTFTGNANSGSAPGSAIFNEFSSLMNVTNCTISQNTGQGGSALGQNGGSGAPGKVNLKNSIVAGNTGGNASGVTDLGNNLTVGNPLLAPLGNYGGQTQTMALLPGSPAIDAGTTTGAPTTDQRGISRVGAVDIGAFESRGFTISATSGTPQSAALSAAFSSALVATIASAFGEPVTGGMVTFTAPGSGASGRFTGNVITTNVTIDAGGVATAPTFTANSTAGSYNVTAGGTGMATPAVFGLTNTRRPTTTVVTSSANPAEWRSLMTFTVTVTSTTGTPTGTVQLTENGNQFGLALTLNSNGVATFTTNEQPIGSLLIRAVYSGDATFETSFGTLNQQVNCPTTVVTSNTDSGSGSLRDIVFRACPGSTITFAPNLVSPITLFSNQIVISENVTIQGPGANLLTIRRSADLGTPRFSIFNVFHQFVTATISGLTLSNADSTNLGGAISNLGTLTLDGLTISNNRTSLSGSAINNGGNLTLTNSTLTANHADTGAAIYNSGTVSMTNSTLVGNTNPAGEPGSAIFNGSDSIFNVTNCTITQNTGQLAISQNGGGTGKVNLRNSIVAGNIGGDITGGGATDLGNNVIGGSPLLGPLANNGGPTMTMALLQGSPAIDAGNNCVLTNSCSTPVPSGLVTDQRGVGFNRSVDGNGDGTATVDIGAFEVQLGVPDITDKTTNEDTQLQFSFSLGGADSITSITATSSNTSLVPNDPANIVVTGSGSTRTLTINPAANQFGTTTITVTVNGANSQSVTDTFVLTVNAVNDTPSFTMGSDQTVAEDSAAQSVPGWATNLFAGPANESGQTLTFLLQNNTNPSLFSAGPAISSTGTLTYNPAANATGSATLTIALMDNGGGSATSPSQTFTISITAVADTPSVTNATTNANTQTTSGLVISGNPVDGPEVTHFKITGITNGTLFKNNGTTVVNNGDFITFAEGNAGLKFTPGTLNGSFAVQASLSASDAALGGGTATATITINPLGGVIRFSAVSYVVAEGAGFRVITVERSGDTSQAVTVDYASSDHSNPPDFSPCNSPGAGFASSRCDFTTAIGTLRFAAGETSKTFNVLISQDNYVEGPETLSLTLSNPTAGAVFGVPATVTLEITDDLSEPATNPIDTSSEFVRSQYHDFLGREPDAPGLAFWTDNIEKCNDPARRPAGQTVAFCIDKQRESTAVAFFSSPEFQITGGFVYHLYKGSLTGSPNYDGGSPGSSLGRFPTSLEFMRDVSQVSEGIVVNNQISGAVVEANRNRLAADFVQRPEFAAKYGGLNHTLYVQELFNTTGISATAAEKQALVDGLTNGTETKATVLRKVVDGTVVISEGNVQFTTTYGQAFYDQEYRRVFVFMEYVGYLRRNPDTAGFVFWLGKLNQYNGDPFQAEMVRAFILSPEYRSRFGQP